MPDEGLCRRVAAALPSAVELLTEPATPGAPAGPGAVAALGDPALATHLTRCLRCQAELARYRALRRLLRQLLAPDAASTPRAPDLVAASGPAPAAGRSGRRLVLVGSLTLAALAGMATAGVAATRTVRTRAS